MKPPKVYISYSWSSPQYRDVIRSYAERLITDKVEVTLDEWELSDGHVKYTSIEKMVSDSKITHILVFSDQQYCEKADGRKEGAGTESQIITQEIYFKVQQEKFIPIVCQMQENGEPYLPAFLKSRNWIDFSTTEKVNANWGKLHHVLFDKTMTGFTEKKKSETFSSVSLSITVILASLTLGGFYYATEMDKQKSFERINDFEASEKSKLVAMKIEEKRRLDERADNIRNAELQIRRTCVVSAQNNAAELYRNYCLEHPTNCPNYHKGAYLFQNYENEYNACLQSNGL